MPSSPKKAAALAKAAYEEGRKDERERCLRIINRAATNATYEEKLFAKYVHQELACERP